MKIFVYGTLKRDGALHKLVKDAKYLGVDKLQGYMMFELGWFPGVIKTDDLRSSIYGEVYEINDDALFMIDIAEGSENQSGNESLFNRETCTTRFGDAFIYLYNRSPYKVEVDGKFYSINDVWNYPKVPHGYWQIEKKWDVSIGDDVYKGDATKIVFDMRFFDTSAGRCTTNTEYMTLYKLRTNDLDINTSVEDVFLTDLLLQTNLKEN